MSLEAIKKQAASILHFPKMSGILDDVYVSLLFPKFSLNDPRLAFFYPSGYWNEF